MFKYSIESKNGTVGGLNSNYNLAIMEAQSIMKSLFPKAVLSEKLNDLVSSPDYLVYEDGQDKIFFKIEKEIELELNEENEK